jgi:transposase
MRIWPDFKSRKKKLLLARESDGKRAVVFEDETGFSLHPRLGRIWGKKGTKSYIYTRSQHQKRLNLFGWVDPINGFHGVMKWVRGNTDGFLKMLTRITYRFRGVAIDLWADNASWHKGPRVREFLSAHPNLSIHYLPPYHPELNYQERVWRMLRYEETTNTYYETMTQLEVAVFSRSRRWKPPKIRNLCQRI